MMTVKSLNLPKLTDPHKNYVIGKKFQNENSIENFVQVVKLFMISNPKCQRNTKRIKK